MTVSYGSLAVIVDAPGSQPAVMGSKRRTSGRKPRRDEHPERVRCEIMRSQMEAERSSFMGDWKELGRYILPRRPRFDITDSNRGGRRTRNIIDSTATQAAKTLASGMMSGLTSPARPWFRFTTGDSELDERPAVKAYLDEVRRRMSLAFLKSNLYQALPVIYSDMGVFGTAAMAIEEDKKSVFRFYPFPIGTYAVQNDERGQIKVFMRIFRQQVWQIVERWGNMKNGVPDFLRGEESQLSPVCQNLWNKNMRQQWLDIAHFVYPNQAFDETQIDSRFKKFKSTYYEYAAPAYLLLEEKGFDEFPVLVPRWEVNAEDSYGTSSPGYVALGDIIQLQTLEKRIAQAIEKQVNPPVKGPTALRAASVSVLPGGVTYVDEREGTKGLTPVYQVQFDVSHAEQKQAQTRERIKDVFYTDLFLMMENMDQTGRERVTATEIMEKKEEKLLMLGPVLEQSNQDLYDPLINRCYNIMNRKRLLPDPPPELYGHDFHPEYISVMAQAQKAVANANIERFVSFLAQVSQAVVSSEQDPEVFDNVDIDAMIEEYASALGISPKVIKSEDIVKALRAKRQQEKDAAAQAAQAQQLAGAAKDASGADMSKDSALTRMFGRRTAGDTLKRTDTPPIGPQGIPVSGGPT